MNMGATSVELLLGKHFSGLCCTLALWQELFPVPGDCDWASLCCLGVWDLLPSVEAGGKTLKVWQVPTWCDQRMTVQYLWKSQCSAAFHLDRVSTQEHLHESLVRRWIFILPKPVQVSQQLWNSVAILFSLSTLRNQD